MTPKDKAKELVEKYFELVKDTDEDGFPSMGLQLQCSKKCALIAVGEILETICLYSDERNPYWLQVKEEINKL